MQSRRGQSASSVTQP
nr:unnamed protein product [Callosobruchus chinensis]